MKRPIFYLFACFLGITLVVPLVRAGEAGAGSAEQQAALLEAEVVAAKAAEAVPRWKASVGDIEKTTSVLMETNARIAAEHRRLSHQVLATSDAIQAQKELNRSHLAALEQRKTDIESQQRMQVAKLGLAEAERSVARKHADVAALQTKLRVVDNRLGLLKLKLSEIALQQKALEVDRKSKEQFAGSALRSEIEVLSQKLESQTEQEKMIRQKLSELQSDQRPFIGEARALSAELASLKQGLAAAASREQSLSDQLAAVQDQKVSLDKDKNVLQYRALAEEKQKLSSRIAEVEGNIRAVQQAKAGVPQVLDDLKAEQIALEGQNKVYSAEITNLRENVAILEYKINSLERYQDRNRNKGR